MHKPSVSGVVTTLNNDATLHRCLASLRGLCSELIVLDSGSTDATAAIAAQFGARFSTQAFAGYSAQKAAALALATGDWVILLDSDEALDSVAQAAILRAISAPQPPAGFLLARRERIFWRHQHASSKHNLFLRVFQRPLGRMSGHAVHESVLLNGAIATLPGTILHDSDTSIAVKVHKLNQYSSLAAAAKVPPRGVKLLARLTLYPAWYFFRAYIVRRQFLNGWAGYINSVELAHYAFLKYAKAFERSKASAASELNNKKY
jgi:glycosyltransferase involved in cell wall biosynthesis